jgi:hypothetical protein
VQAAAVVETVDVAGAFEQTKALESAVRGQARIDVPAELLLKAPTKPDTNAPTSLPSTPPTSSPVADLIERLETRLSEALTDRAIARAELARADRLIEELRVDRDNWHSLANRSWWRRLVG